MIAAVAAVASVVLTGLLLNATREGQLTDRFTKAVDQLDRAGADHLQARLGAVYALERLARDSSRDHPAVVEVLSAFVRTTTTPPLGSASTEGAGTCPDQMVSADVSAALTILGRRVTTQDDSAQVNLYRACLVRAYLRDANLAHASLRETNLSHANLLEVNLAHAYVHDENFADAAIDVADLTNARVIGGNFARASLTGSNLTGASFVGANLTRAFLMDANLARVTFTDANLTGTDFTRADLRGADLRNTTHDETTIVTGAIVDETTQGKWW